MTKLREALALIKEECEKHDKCGECPMRKKQNNASCSLTDFPSEWELKTDNEIKMEIPRVFK